MDDDKLKLILALLSGIVFALIFILLAFVLPIKEKTEAPHSAPIKYLDRNPFQSPTQKENGN